MTAEIYSLVVLEARSLKLASPAKSRCRQDCTASRGSREFIPCVFQLLVAGGCWHFLTRGHFTLVSGSVVALCLWGFPGGASGEALACQCRSQKRKMRVWPLGWDSSVLARRTPWTEEPGALQPTGSQRVWGDLASHILPLDPHSASLLFVFVYIFLTVLHGMWDVSCQFSNQKLNLWPLHCTQSLKYWPAREGPLPPFYKDTCDCV